jgi:hypothetical protein
MRRERKGGCEFIWGRSSRGVHCCGGQGSPVHVTLSETSRELPLAEGARQGTFVLCRAHMRWLERDGAKIALVGSI